MCASAYENPCVSFFLTGRTGTTTFTELSFGSWGDGRHSLYSFSSFSSSPCWTGIPFLVEDIKVYHGQPPRWGSVILLLTRGHPLPSLGLAAATSGMRQKGGWAWGSPLSIPCACAQLLSHVGLCDPTDCSRPGSYVHGISQARVLEWGAISSSRESSQPRDRTHVSSIAGGFFTVWATREAPRKGSVKSNSETW